MERLLPIWIAIGTAALAVFAWQRLDDRASTLHATVRPEVSAATRVALSELPPAFE